MRGLSFLVVIVFAGGALLWFGGLTIAVIVLGLPDLLRGDPVPMVLAPAGAFMVFAIGRFIGSAHEILFKEPTDAGGDELVPDEPVSAAPHPALPLTSDERRRVWNAYFRRNN